MNRRTILLGVAICSLSAVAATGAGRMQPGLWKMSTDIDTGMKMPAMPPEALAMMKARGMNVPMPGAPMVTEVCITPDQAAMDKPPLSAQEAQRDMGCTMQNVKSGGNSYSADMVCTGRMNGKGHTEVVWNGPHHMKTQSTFTGMMEGQTMTTKTNVTADFVSANCGAVKPFTMPKMPTPPKPPATP